MRQNHAGKEEEARSTLEFIPLPVQEEVEEELIKHKNLHERPPPVSSEPPRHRYENEDMEDDQ